MKKRILSIIAVVILLSGCEKFLDTENLTKQDTSNWPMTVKDAEQAITAIYTSLSMSSSSPMSAAFYLAEVASDDRFGGGGESDLATQAIDRLMTNGVDRMAALWTSRYRGIFRANSALETLDNCTGWESEEQKNHFKGEAYFLRALYYFELSQLFGEVPLIVQSAVENIPKTPAVQTYALIAADLEKAISMLNAVPYSGPAQAGHASRWAAQALMARVFLFYTGYYKKDALPLANDDGSTGSISKSEVIEWLNDCIASSGHDLVSDFRNLWPETNEYTASNYTYPNGAGLRWEGDGNKESVFAIKYGIGATWDRTGYSNQFIVYFGLRSGNGSSNTFPFGQGWGFGTVNSDLWEEWQLAEPDDVRRTASILDVNQLSGYIWGAGKQMEETGFWQKKYIPITAKDATGKVLPSYSVPKDGASPAEFQLCHTQDLVLIRFADVLLMHSELTGTANGINRVRQRVDLQPVTYSLSALKKERRWELAFEGIRYFDLMRWGDAPEALARQAGVKVKNNKLDAVMGEAGGGYKARYAATGGFWPIPETQIALSEGVLTQNPGWGTAEASFLGWR
ncbi:RagB/SusD family nutrient uptake outer membrane protein [Desertivirga xinjiangensis]|uniref:RagB/SusD family nutrient uptake outer membrane protein n=1 Tax=Desertivirga xinjiangensis TaxID=539206 RepID=UPI00210EC35C|nr:RagB/SusD family nutrient uptake outer membrane protein [Pedobacter xinjiangensis]